MIVYHQHKNTEESTVPWQEASKEQKPQVQTVDKHLTWYWMKLPWGSLTWRVGDESLLLTQSVVNIVQKILAQ